MIDHVSRKRMAQAVRHFTIGRISNHEYEDKICNLYYMEKMEEQLYEVFSTDAYWIGDSDTYHLKGNDRLSAEDRKNQARTILFLRSKFPYRWPEMEEASSLSSKSILKAFTIFIVPMSLCGLLIPSSFLICLSIISMLIVIFSFIQLKIKEQKVEVPDEPISENFSGNMSVWPFFTREEYEYALAHPVYLSRKK